MDIEGILAEIRKALMCLADNPTVHCADCGRAEPVLPIRIEAVDPNRCGSEWSVSNWSHVLAKGWVEFRPMECYGPTHIYCPDCYGKRSL